MISPFLFSEKRAWQQISILLASMQEGSEDGACLRL
jgi:hypothetical protein